MKKLLTSAFFLPCICFAAHPLVTDDTGTQGTSGVELEMSVDASRHKSDEAIFRNRLASATLAYGWADNLDLELSLPHLRTSATGFAPDRGIGDAGLALKWRFWERSGFSLGLKPQVAFATGDDQRGLGNGKTWYGANLLAAYEADPVSVLANAGYTNNKNTVDARKNLWNISAALLWKIESKATAVFDIGTYRNTDPSDRRNPAFAIIGMIYSMHEKLDLDFGVRKGLNRAEADYAAGVGLTVRW